MTLINKYRPNNWDEVIGQNGVVDALEDVVNKRSFHTYLFTGESGVGKTTLARITAKNLGCSPEDLQEIDGATHTGVDEMREVMEGLRYRPIGKSKIKAVLLDECHMLSKNAWNSLLKSLEEPPDYAYWFLCTTEIMRVPASVKTRAFRCELNPVKLQELTDWLQDIAKLEKLKLPNGVVELCAKEALGSPRQALVNLARCSVVKSLPEAKALLRSAEGSTEAVELARALVRKASWLEIQEVLKGLQKINPESVRHVVCAYVTKVILNAEKEASAGRGAEILDAFMNPFHQADGVSPLVMACCKLVLS